MIFIAWAFLHFVLTGDGNPARGEQRIAEDDRADGVFVGGVATAHVVISERAEIVDFDQTIERRAGSRGAGELLGGAVRLHVELLVKMRDAILDLSIRDIRTQCRQLVHFDQLHMPAEGSALLCQIRINVEHAAVIVAPSVPGDCET